MFNFKCDKMTQTNLFSKMFIALFAMGLIFTNCEKDDPNPSEGTAEDVTIPIDENSAFNMKNFITSFDQLFVANNRWAWDFSHDYTDGKAMTSYQNYKVFGAFGKKVQTATHNYNSEGIITSSGRTSKLNPDDILTFEYEFDLEGFIAKLTKYYKGELQDIVHLEYNENNQLIKKTHEAFDTDDEEWYETFTYNSDGMIASYMDDDSDKSEYKYSNRNMVEEKQFVEGVLYKTKKYKYDSEGRVTKMYEDENTWYSEIQYFSDMMTFFEYYGNILKYKEEYGVGFKEIKSYKYEYNDGVFEYCMAKENDDDRNTVKKYYYEGTVDNLQLVGYSVIDSRNENKDNKKTKESVYNASGTKLYYAEFTLAQYSEEYDYWYISETNWFSADGTSIDKSSISEDWVFKLVR